MTNFNLYSKYYDLLYKDKDYEAEAGYVADTIKELIPDAESILELGCGSGSHAEFLCKEGFVVTGIERSEPMLNAAQSKNIKGFSCIQSDIACYQLDKKFDVAISLFHVLNYLTTNEDLFKCFKLTNQHLVDGGIFLFDIWYSPAVYLQKPETRIKRMQDTDTEIVRIAESTMVVNSNVVEVNFEVMIKDRHTGKTDVLKEKHPMRHFSRPEIELFASQTGFELVRIEEFLSRNEPGSDTWGICCVLKKVSTYE